LIRLGELAERTGEIGARPSVALCRAASRSAQATVMMREAGFDDGVTLAGGMLRWPADGHAIEGGRS
jgi:rhodanese-related sulfurtransferase